MGLTDYSRMDKEFFESGVRAERERIIKLLRHWDTETIAADYGLEDSRILDEMRRAYDIGYEYGAEDNR